MIRLFKAVKFLSCIFCHREFPLDQKDFHTMNRHGWGCCDDCWQMGMPDKTSENSVYIKPGVLAAMHNRNNPTDKHLPKT